MSEEDDKRHPEFGPVPQYKAHFELWNEAAARNGHVFSPARRNWSPPRLSMIGSVTITVDDASDMLAPVAPHYTSRSPVYVLAAAALGALLAVVMMRPWKPAHTPSLGANLTAASALKVEESPAANASAAISSNQPIVAPPGPLASAPAEPAGAPSVESPSDLAPDMESDDAGELTEQFPPEKKTLLESSLRADLAREGFAGIGVSVAGDGDVFLDGIFMSRGDQQRAIAMVRAFKDVRDIYFSGHVWNGDNSRDQPALGSSDATRNLASRSRPSQLP